MDGSVSVKGMAVGASNPIWEQLRFSPKTGRVWLEEARLAIMSSDTFGNLRHGLVEGLGVEKAERLLTRLGFSEGSKLAALFRRLRPGGTYLDAMDMRDEVQAMGGFASSVSRTLDIDSARGEFHCELTWSESLEANEHILIEGIGTQPACWILTGHVSGFVTTLIGRSVLFREVECQAMGHERCRLIGKFTNEWGSDAATYSSYLRPQPHVNAFIGNGGFGDAEDVVGSSRVFFGALSLLRKVAPTNATVLVLGETGVGKEVFARMLHRMSARAQQPFIAVNCAAIPESLMEGELFGVERGAYTGATQSRPGRFERAEGGTLFLDEVGTLSFSAQAKLLRVLQEGEVERVGDRATRRVDVRVVAATNADLEQATLDGRFRQDLYFRLNVFPILIPPLRERPEDIPLLLHYFLMRYSRQHQRHITGVSERTMEALLSYDFPGNVRELEHMIERAVIMSDDGAALDLSHFASFGSRLSRRFRGPDNEGVKEKIDPSAAPSTAADLIGRDLNLHRAETGLLTEAVALAGGNLAYAARLLGISRPQLAYRLKKRKVGDSHVSPKG